MRKENKHQAFENICRLTGKTRPQVNLSFFGMEFNETNGPVVSNKCFSFLLKRRLSIFNLKCTPDQPVARDNRDIFNGTFCTFLLPRISAENISDIIQRNH